MQPTCSATWRSSWSLRLFWLAAATSIGCGRQNGVVGRNYPADAATNAPIFLSEFVNNDGVWSVAKGFSAASVDFGQPDANARDGRVAELRFPGDASLAAADGAGPAYVTQLATFERFHFGTLRTRVSFGSCAASEEVVHAILGYFSDGTDLDGNGLTDNVEIDLQIACGFPQYAYLSIYTDYHATADGPVFRKLSHIVDFSSGAAYDTPQDNSDEFVASGTDPNLLRPNLVSANTYYELGYEWHPDSIRFFIVDGADEVTLWTLNDASHVPQLPVYLMYNLWHPETHWFPTPGEAEFPANDVVMKVDWVEFVPSD